MSQDPPKSFQEIKKDSGCRIVVIYFSKNDSHIAVDLYFDRENIKNIGP